MKKLQLIMLFICTNISFIQASNEQSFTLPPQSFNENTKDISNEYENAQNTSNDDELHNVILMDTDYALIEPLLVLKNLSSAEIEVTQNSLTNPNKRKHNETTNDYKNYQKRNRDAYEKQYQGEQLSNKQIQWAASHTNKLKKARDHAIESNRRNKDAYNKKLNGDTLTQNEEKWAQLYEHRMQINAKYKKVHRNEITEDQRIYQQRNRDAHEKQAQGKQLSNEEIQWAELYKNKLIIGRKSSIKNKQRNKNAYNKQDQDEQLANDEIQCTESHINRLRRSSETAIKTNQRNKEAYNKKLNGDTLTQDEEKWAQSYEHRIKMNAEYRKANIHEITEKNKKYLKRNSDAYDKQAQGEQLSNEEIQWAELHKTKLKKAREHATLLAGAMLRDAQTPNQ